MQAEIPISRVLSHAIHRCSTLPRNLLAPFHIRGVLCRGILFDKGANDFLSIVEFIQAVPEQGRLLEMLYMRLPAL